MSRDSFCSDSVCRSNRGSTSCRSGPGTLEVVRSHESPTGCSLDESRPRCGTCKAGFSLNPATGNCTTAVCSKPAGCETAVRGLGCETGGHVHDVPAAKCEKCSGNWTLTPELTCKEPFQCQVGTNKREDVDICDVAVCNKPDNCTVVLQGVAECEGRIILTAPLCCKGLRSAKVGELHTIVLQGVAECEGTVLDNTGFFQAVGGSSCPTCD